MFSHFIGQRCHTFRSLQLSGGYTYIAHIVRGKSEGSREQKRRRRANPCERQYEAERFNDAYDIFALSKWAAWAAALGVQRKKYKKLYIYNNNGANVLTLVEYAFRGDPRQMPAAAAAGATLALIMIIAAAAHDAAEIFEEHYYSLGETGTHANLPREMIVKRASRF